MVEVVVKMIKRIIASMFFVCLIVAIILASVGIEKVSLGGYFMVLLRTTNMELQDYAIAIPDIPRVPQVQTLSDGFDILDVLNGLITFINGIVDMLNFMVMIINAIIQVVEFLFILLKNLITTTGDIKDDYSQEAGSLLVNF